MKKHKPKRLLGKDTIDYSLVWETNDTYEEDLAKWEPTPFGWEDEKPLKEYLRFNLIINGVKLNQYSDPHELVRAVNQKSCYYYHYWYLNDYEYEVMYPDNDHERSDFYPFTYSCGVAGCNGIFDGVHLKVRGRSVEWKVKKNMGYDFLDKTFYQFDKQDYFAMIERLKGELK